ncbi:MAG: hypothetical protein RBG13Loki_3204 [Promethearchaeota archaeon CR_4]|nr:MAG: hypothetical protein RBG13Loki_3204 [Candidatus Lokiarchaeota archaeon CR_4]
MVQLDGFLLLGGKFMAFPIPEFFPDTNVWQILFNVGLSTLGRAFDLLVSHYMSKKRYLEANPRVQRLGWIRGALIQIPIILLGAMQIYLAFFIFLSSIFFVLSNLQGAYYVRKEGEEEHYREIQQMVKNTPWRWLILDELLVIGTALVAGFLIIIFVVLGDILGIIFVAMALIFFSIVKFASTLHYYHVVDEMPVIEKNDLDNKKKLNLNNR